MSSKIIRSNPCSLKKMLKKNGKAEIVFLFCSWNGLTVLPHITRTWLRRFIKRKKLKLLRFCYLLHTSAIMLINQGVHAKTIASRLGHADIRTTKNIYGLALESADQQAANTFNSILSPKSNIILKLDGA
jgi:integrase